MQAGYLKTAWRDITDSPGWFGRLFTLALVGLIPVFGQIVVLGYLYGWAREMAWGVHSPLPAHIFANEDGKLYSRGFFALVIGLVCTLIPRAVDGLLSGATKIGAVVLGLSGSSVAPLVAGALALNAVISVLVLALSLLLMAFQWVGTMRMSLYGRLSAGFQLKKIWAMIRYDTNGILRIVGMDVVVGVVLIAGLFFVVLIVMIVFVAVLAVSVGLDVSGLGAASLAEDVATVFSPKMLVLVLVALIVLALALSFAMVFENAMVARALGYWTLRFDVPRWLGQDDPMPFQTAAASGGYSPPAGGGTTA